MEYNVNYQDAAVLKNNGVKALKDALGDDGARKFLALFTFSNINFDSDELLQSDYTEWRKTQSYNNDPNIDDVLTYFKNNPDKPWKRDSDGTVEYTKCPA